MNFILLDACAFIQSEGPGVKCKKSLQMNELRLFATSVSFMNGTALTHLSTNVVPSDVVDILYFPETKRGTLAYLNRLRIMIMKNNDEKIQRDQEKEDEKNAREKLLNAQYNNNNNNNNLCSQPVKKSKKSKQQRQLQQQQLQQQQLQQQQLQQQQQQQKQPPVVLLHPIFKVQLERIIAESPRIEHLGIKWAQRREDQICRAVNDAFAQLKSLSRLRSLRVTLCTFDYCRFVEYLPPLIEELSLSWTFNWGYSPAISVVPPSSAAAAVSAVASKKKRKRKNKNANHPSNKAPTPANNNAAEEAVAQRNDPAFNFERFLKLITHKLPRLKTLRLRCSNINGHADFSNLAGHKNLTSIIISHNERFLKKSFVPESIPTRCLKLRLTECELRGRLDWSKFPATLLYLDLSGNKFKTHDREPLDASVLPRGLQVLKLARNERLKIQFPLINCPPHLQVLDVGCTYATGKLDFSTLPDSLVSLSMNLLPAMDRTPSDLSHWPMNLRNLILRRTNFSGSVLIWSSLPPLLERLDLFNCNVATVTGLDLQALPCAQSLRKVDISHNIHIAGVLKFSKAGLPNLVKFVAAHCGFTAIDGSKGFPPKLQRLNVSNTLLLEQREIFDFSLLPRTLTSLAAQRCAFTGSPDFSKLPRELHVCNLSNNELATTASAVAEGLNEALDLTALPSLYLRAFDLSRNKYEKCRLLLSNLGPRLMKLNLGKNNFDIHASSLDTESAINLHQLRIDGLEWADEKHFGTRDKHVRDLDAFSDSDNDDDDDDDDDDFDDNDDDDDDDSTSDDDDDEASSQYSDKASVSDGVPTYESSDGATSTDLRSGWGSDWRVGDEDWAFDQGTDISDRSSERSTMSDSDDDYDDDEIYDDDDDDNNYEFQHYDDDDDDKYLRYSGYNDYFEW